MDEKFHFFLFVFIDKELKVIQNKSACFNVRFLGAEEIKSIVGDSVVINIIYLGFMTEKRFLGKGDYE